MAEDSGLGGLLGWFGRPYDPQAAYEGLLSSQPTKDALRARSLASIAQAFGAGAGSDARGSAIPFGTTMGNAAAAAYSGQDALIAARNVAAEQMLHAAQAQKTTAEAAGLPIQFKMMQAFFDRQQKEAAEAAAQKAGLSPASLLAAGGGGGGETYWTPQGLAALRPTEGAYDQIHYPSGSPSTASGAYGFLDTTWQQQAPKAGVDVEKYPRAYLAPPELQDKVAAITPISHWTGTDAKGNPYNFRAQRLATNPAFVTGGAAPAEPRQAGGGGREPTAAETAIYAQTPGTVQNAARRAPTDSAFWNTAQPTGTLGAAPSGAPLGPAVAPPTPPGGTPATSPAAARGLLDLPEVPSYSGALGGTPAAPSLPGQGATLIPRAAPGGQLGGLLDTQPDPVTARTMAALKSTAGAAPGVNATDTGAVTAAAPPADPRLAALARVAGPGAAEPGGLLGGSSLQRTIDQAAGATVPPVTQGGGLLPLNAPPPAPPPAAPPVAPPAAVPPVAAPGALPPMPAMPTMPPIPTTMPAMPSFTPPAPTTLEGMAQAITGISSLTGHPAPAFMQELAKMPAQKAMEAYKAYVTGQANMLSDQYKKQLEITGAGVISQLQAQGALPSKLTELTTEQNLRLRNALAEKGLVFENGQYRIDPSWLSAEAQRQQQQVDFERRKSLATEGTKTDIKNRDQVIDEAKSAQLEQVTLNNMRNNAQNIYTGPYADYKNYLNRILVSTGLDPSRANAVASFEDFTKNSGQLVRQAVQQTSARAAVQEFKLIAGALPTTDTSPLGLQRVLGEYQGLANYRLAKLEAQTAYENRPGSMGAGDTSGFEAAFAKQVSPYAFVVDHMSQADRQALFTQVMKQEGGKQELQRLQEQLSYMHGQGWGRTQ